MTKTVSVVTKSKGLVAVAPLHKLFRRYRCSLPHGVAKLGTNIPFLIQLSTFTDDEILFPKDTYVGICDATLNEQYVFVVGGDLARNQSTNKEDRAALHLKKKAEN